jgi:GrpB-like predicted nucleotidyltransferase (UPF0157 family)
MYLQGMRRTGGTIGNRRVEIGNTLDKCTRTQVDTLLVIFLPIDLPAMALTKILIEDYSPDWGLVFEQLKSIYQSHLGDLVIDIQHVGSTSVYGLAAKPVIDIDLVIRDRKDLDLLIERLALLGYEHRGTLGITDRDAFMRKSDKTPEDGSSRTWQKHNLYVCPADSISLKNHIALRDFLRNNPVKAKEYGELKRNLAEENSDNIDRYIEGKTPFITGILKELGFDSVSLSNIAGENKAG